MAITNLTNSGSFRIHGNAFEGQALTGGLDLYTITTTLDINPVGVDTTNGTFDPEFLPLELASGATPNGAQRFNKLIELISTRAQPVIIGGVAATTGDTPTYSFTFYIEHPYAWEVNALETASQTVTRPTLSDTINGVLDFVTGSTIGTDGVNTTVAKAGQFFNDLDPNNRPNEI